MGRLQYQVFRVMEQAGLVPGEPAPKQERDGPILGVHGLQDGVGIFLPSGLRVGGWLVGPYGKGRVQQEHSLFCPGSQVAMGRDGGILTPFLTEKDKPIASLGLW